MRRKLLTSYNNKDLYAVGYYYAYVCQRTLNPSYAIDNMGWNVVCLNIGGLITWS